MKENGYEIIDNLSLIENDLLHIEFELNRSEPSFFKTARDSHQVLLRSMVEALRGSANLRIKGRSKDKERQMWFQKGDQPWKEIHKEKVDGLQKAWRFSAPKISDPPKRNDHKPEKTNVDYLIPFYDLLAMIQSNAHMKQYVFSQSLLITDKELSTLEWLHENIRNEYEHFIPKLYSAPVGDLLNASKICLRIAFDLFNKSKNIFLDDSAKRLIVLLEKNINQLRQHKT